MLGPLKPKQFISPNQRHPEKQSFPIDLTPAGIVIVFNPELLNAYVPILITVSGILIFINCEQLLNIESGIDDILDSLTSDRLEQYWNKLIPFTCTVFNSTVFNELFQEKTIVSYFCNICVYN